MLRIDVDGADRVARGLRNAAGDLGDLGDPAADAADRAAARLAPVLSGRLRTSITSTAAGPIGRVHVGAVYAAPIHYGWPARGIRPQPYADDDLLTVPAVAAVAARVEQITNTI